MRPGPAWSFLEIKNSVSECDHLSCELSLPVSNFYLGTYLGTYFDTVHELVADPQLHVFE